MDVPLGRAARARLSRRPPADKSDAYGARP